MWFGGQMRPLKGFMWFLQGQQNTSPQVSFFAFLALDRAVTRPFIQAFWLGNDFTVFVFTTSSTHLLTYDVTDEVYSSGSMWFSWVVASLKIYQSMS